MRRLTNCGGFIFIETLLTLMLLSMAAMMVMRSLSGIQKINRDMAVKTIALHLANGKLAECEYNISNELPVPDASTETFDDVLGNPDDNDKGMTVEFAIKVIEGNPVAVTVMPKVNGTERGDLQVTVEKYIIKK